MVSRASNHRKSFGLVTYAGIIAAATAAADPGDTPVMLPPPYGVGGGTKDAAARAAEVMYCLPLRITPSWAAGPTFGGRAELSFRLKDHRSGMREAVWMLTAVRSRERIASTGIHLGVPSRPPSRPALGEFPPCRPWRLMHAAAGRPHTAPGVVGEVAWRGLDRGRINCHLLCSLCRRHVSEGRLVSSLA